MLATLLPTFPALAIAMLAIAMISANAPQPSSSAGARLRFWLAFLALVLALISLRPHW